MENKFINCPKCGTRNFTEDTICGFCKTKLNSSDNIQQTSADNKALKKANYFVLILIFAGLAFLYYNIFHKEIPTVSPDVQLPPTNYQTNLPEYTGLKTELNNKRGFNVSVHIDKKLPENQLKSLAQNIKSDINAVSEKGVVFFLLPEMVDNNGAWAAVDFDPAIRVRLLGQSINDEQTIKSGLDKITDYVGLWQDNKSQGEIIIRIRKDKIQGYVIEYISSTNPKPSELAASLKKVKKNGKTIYRETDNTGQFYLLEDNGDLSVYDDYGFVETYLKLKPTNTWQSEKEYIKESLKKIQLRVYEAKKSFNALRNDEIEWGQYIRNWNISAKNYREENRKDNFEYIQSLYYQESLSDLLLIGNSYAVDDDIKVKELENKLNTDIISTLREIKNSGNTR